MKFCTFIEQNDDGSEDIMPNPTEIKIKELKARQRAEIAVGIINAALAGGAILFVAWLLSNLP